jgi:hypothetical protein
MIILIDLDYDHALDHPLDIAKAATQRAVRQQPEGMRSTSLLYVKQAAVVRQRPRARV